MGPRGLTQGFEGQHFFIVFINFLTFLLQPEGGGGVNPRQHCRLSICENWLSWTVSEQKIPITILILKRGPCLVKLRREYIYSQFINKHENVFCLICTVMDLKVRISKPLSLVFVAFSLLRVALACCLSACRHDHLFCDTADQCTI